MPWAKGQSGNAKGRPPKKRALTDLLEKTGKRKLNSGGSAKDLFADKVWEGLATGKMTFNDDHTIDLAANDWIALAKLVLGQIDGPPSTTIDMTSGGQPLDAKIFIQPVHSRTAPPVKDEDDAD